jgi:hypothetical protein
MTESVYKVVSQKSILVQTLQLILYASNKMIPESVCRPGHASSSNRPAGEPNRLCYHAAALTAVVGSEREGEIERDREEEREGEGEEEGESQRCSGPASRGFTNYSQVDKLYSW